MEVYIVSIFIFIQVCLTLTQEMPFMFVEKFLYGDFLLFCYIQQDVILV